MTLLLAGQHIAIFIAEGFDPMLLESTSRALQREGAITKIASWQRAVIAAGEQPLTAAQHAETTAGEIDARDFDAAILVGGNYPGEAPDRQKLTAFVQDLHADRKSVAAIAQGVDLLVEAGVVSGLRLAAAPELQDAIRAGGGEVVDQAVVVHENLVTAGDGAAVDAFNDQTIAVIQARLRLLRAGLPDQDAVGLAAS